MFKRKLFFKFFVFALLVSFGALVGGVFDLNFAQAGTFDESTKAGDNMLGYAWSENIGWVSFNSDNCNIVACPGGINADYGVNINYRDGSIEGYAWSSNVGWIYFGNGATASYDKVSGEISGDATILSLDQADDRNLKLRWAGANPYGVETMGVSQASVYVDEANAGYGVFTGWAWNEGDTANTGIGWLSFNSSNQAGPNPYAVTANMNFTPSKGSEEMWRTVPGPAEQVLPAGNLEVISEGDEVRFTTVWDNESTDDDFARMFVCRDDTGVNTTNVSDTSNTATIAQTGIDAWTCNGGEWGSNTAAQGDGSVEAFIDYDGDHLADRVQAVDIGTNKRYYTVVCDQFAACSSVFTSDPFLVNDQPDAGPISTVGPLDHLTPDPTDRMSITIGVDTYPVVSTPPLASSDPYGNMDDHEIQFYSGWDDVYTDGEMSMYVCSTDSFDRTHAAQTCNDRTWCTVMNSPVGADITGTLDCQGSLDGTETPGVNDYYVFMCDGYGACTETPAHGEFFINQRPTVADNTMTAPNWNPSDAATNPVADTDLQATMEWGFADVDGGSMTDGYVWVREDNNAAVMDGIASVATDFGPTVADTCSGVTCSVTMNDNSPYPKLAAIEWDTSYRWEARVRDNFAWSLPREFDLTDTGTLTDDVALDHYGDFGVGMNANINTAESSDANKTFTTYKHNFPVVGDAAGDSLVTYFPLVPSAGEEVRATPHSNRYGPGEPAAGVSGDGAESSCDLNIGAWGQCDYFWDTNIVPPQTISAGELKQVDDSWDNIFPAQGSYPPGLTVVTTPDPVKIRFTTEGANQDYNLTIFDQDGYFSSSHSTSIDYVNEKLPSWQEVK